MGKLDGRFFQPWYGLHCVPKGVEVLTPVPVTMNLLGNRVFADDQGKIRSFVQALTQYNWCPAKKRKFGCRSTHRAKAMCRHQGKLAKRKGLEQVLPLGSPGGTNPA
jgi:hypothetical protein